MDWARRHGVAGADLYGAFRAATPTIHPFVAGDVHWNADGHELAASGVLRFLEGSGLLQRRNGRPVLLQPE